MISELKTEDSQHDRPARVPYSKAERAILDKNNPKTCTDGLSYLGVATYLNANFYDHNHGRRTRGAIKRYYEEENKEGDVIRSVKIPAMISKKFSNSDLSRLIVSHAAPMGKKKR